MRLTLSYWGKILLSGVLVSTFVCAPLGMNLRPNVAHADLPVIDVTNIGQTTISAIKNTITAAATKLSASILSSLNIKEYTLDGIAFALAKKVLQQIVRSTIAWINSGFKGSPMFIQDLGQFMTNVADEIAGEFIYGSDLAFLCRPIDIRIALQISYSRSQAVRPPQCTLSQVMDNVEGFLKGNFSAGGWAGMLQLSLNPTDTLLGSMLAAQGSLEIRTAGGTLKKKEELSWGKGFLSKEVCTENAGPPTAGGQSAGQTCKIVTPGDTIAQQLTFDLSSGKQTLISADEINEIISALFGQLAQQALTGAQGLLGLSQSGSGYGGSGFGYSSVNGSLGSAGAGNVSDRCRNLSYLEQLDDPTCNSEMSDGSNEQVFAGGASTGESQFQSLNRRVVLAAQAAMDEAEDSDLSCQNNDSIYEEALGIRNHAESAIADSEAMLQNLAALEAEYDAATSSEAQTEILSQIIDGNYVENLHSEAELIDVEIDTDRTLDDIATLREGIRICIDESGSNDSGGGGGGNFNSSGPVTE